MLQQASDIYATSKRMLTDAHLYRARPCAPGSMAVRLLHFAELQGLRIASNELAMVGENCQSFLAMGC